MTTRYAFLRYTLMAAALCLPSLCFALDASAQTSGALTIGLQPRGLVTHTLPDGTSFTRDATLNPEGISFEDCERDVVVNFPLIASGSASAASGYALYAFAGTKCDQGSTYVAPGASSATCWPVVDGPISYNLSDGFTLSIRARQILAQYSATVKQAYTAVAASDDSVCHLQSTSAPLKVPVYFVFGTDEGLATIGGSGVAPLGVDLAAAAPPTTLSLDTFNTALKADWSATTDQDTVGYAIFYAPAGADAGALSASGVPCPDPFPAGTLSTGDAGAGAGSIASPSMQPHALVAAQDSYLAASGNTTASAVIGDLTNGETYAVGVAATDSFGNIGALSTVGGGGLLVCQAPLASAGAAPSSGDGSSGGCSLGAIGGPGGAGGASLLTGAALVLALRRKKR